MDQYLGGDMEHTHLVKGLDYALLQKVRLEQQQKQQQQGDAAAPASAGVTTMAPPPAPGLPSTAHTPLGHAVLAFLQRNSQQPSAAAREAKAARFRRHATTLVFDVNVRSTCRFLSCSLFYTDFAVRARVSVHKFSS
jgi:RED-like protein N-terminal region